MAHGLKLDGLSMTDLQQLIADAQKALGDKVEGERAELLRKLQALDSIAKPPKAPSRSRSQPSYTHVHPRNGHEWLGRGEPPEAWQDIVSKEDKGEARKAKLKPYRVNR